MSNDDNIGLVVSLSKKILIGVSLVSLVVAVIVVQWNLRLQEQRDDLVKQLTQERVVSQKLKDAAKINDYYFRFDIPTRVSVISEIGTWVDHYLPKYFPEGPFVKKDFLAIAMVESSFDQYLTGKKDEFGVFQILPSSSKWMGVTKNQFDLRVNTELSMFILKKKFDEHKDYKTSIIAYNGLVKKRSGKYSEIYWDKFIRYRRALDDILGDTSLFQK